MIISNSPQHPSRPAEAPLVANPVLVRMDRPVYYVTERGPTLASSPIFCGQAFADTVLKAMHDVLETAGWSIAHIGVYNPRLARKASGAPIIPKRWSNHAYGEAMDFKGIITPKGNLIDIRQMREQHGPLLQNLLSVCQIRTNKARRRAEIVDEGGWYHIGLWPAE